MFILNILSDQEALVLDQKQIWNDFFLGVVMAGQVPIVMSAFFTLVASMELVKSLGNATATEAGVDSSATRYYFHICAVFLSLLAPN